MLDIALLFFDKVKSTFTMFTRRRNRKWNHSSNHCSASSSSGIEPWLGREPRVSWLMTRVLSSTSRSTCARLLLASAELMRARFSTRAAFLRSSSVLWMNAAFWNLQELRLDQDRRIPSLLSAGRSEGRGGRSELGRRLVLGLQHRPHRLGAQVRWGGVSGETNSRYLD